METALAELAEELGLADVDADELNLAFVIPAEQASLGGCNAYEHVYFITLNKGDGSGDDGNDTQQFALGTAEVSEVAWMSIKQVLRALRAGDDEYAPRTKEYVNEMEKELDKILLAGE